MGLAIELGMLAQLTADGEDEAGMFREQLDAVNACLASIGAPAHTEPASIGELDNRADVLSFPYSFIHFLRYAYAHRIADAGWIAAPLAANADPTSDQTLEAKMDQFDSHLICHSDAEGLYVPVEFAEPVFHDALPGGIAGSSYRLLEELIVVRPPLASRWTIKP